MKFLIDECLSPALVILLRGASIDAVHVKDLGLLGRPDIEIFQSACLLNRILITADTDFGEFLVNQTHNLPSLIIFRRKHITTAALFEVLSLHLVTLDEVLFDPSIVVIEDSRMRVRRLDPWRTVDSLSA